MTVVPHMARSSDVKLQTSSSIPGLILARSTSMLFPGHIQRSLGFRKIEKVEKVREVEKTGSLSRVPFAPLSPSHYAALDLRIGHLVVNS